MQQFHRERIGAFYGIEATVLAYILLLTDIVMEGRYVERALQVIDGGLQCRIFKKLPIVSHAILSQEQIYDQVLTKRHRFSTHKRQQMIGFISTTTDNISACEITSMGEWIDIAGSDIRSMKSLTMTHIVSQLVSFIDRSWRPDIVCQIIIKHRNSRKVIHIIAGFVRYDVVLFWFCRVSLIPCVCPCSP